MQTYCPYCLEQALHHKPSSIAGFLAYSFGHHQGKASQDQSFTLPAGTVGPETTLLPAETEIGMGSSIGLLEVPRLGLSVIVLEGTDEHTLQLGAGHIENTALPGELGIAGHRDTFFRPLKDMRQNDRITMLKRSRLLLACAVAILVGLVVVCRQYSVWQTIQSINAGSGVRFYATNPSS